MNTAWHYRAGRGDAPYDGDECPACKTEREDAKRWIEERLRQDREDKDRLIRNVEEWLAEHGGEDVKESVGGAGCAGSSRARRLRLSRMVRPDVLYVNSPRRQARCHADREYTDSAEFTNTISSTDSNSHRSRGNTNRHRHSHP